MKLPPGAVVIDALGGDNAPAAILEGAAAAAGAGVPVLLCATAEVADQTDLPCLIAESVVSMDDEPALALRRNPGSTIRVAARAVAGAPGTTLLSAGSTGATVAAALLEMGRVDGVRRPVIAARIPTGPGRHALLVDAGAMPDPVPEALVVSARLGIAHMVGEGIANPRIGLLNVGHEPGKGNQLARAAQPLLDAACAQAGAVGVMVGNIEPADALSGAVDVIVTDGFTGNVFLKTVEAALAGSASGADGRDHAAIVLGVLGRVLVAHGASTAADITAAATMAARMAAAG